MTDLLEKLENVERILIKYKESKYISNILTCKHLLLRGEYDAFLKEINSPYWWEGDDCIANFSPRCRNDHASCFAGEDDMLLMKSLLSLIRALQEAGVENTSADCWGNEFEW